MTYAFLDTNILLHYKVFDGMPWNEILADDDFIFVICQKVFDEIDKHKDGNKTKIRNRAKTINKYLISYLDEKPMSPLNFKFCPNPSKESTERADFDTSSSDEYIVYAAYEYDSQNNRKVIVSGDGGMKLRAMKVGIKTILINDSAYYVANEPTEEEKRIKQLEKELAKYTSRYSKPVLLFEDETDIVVLQKNSIPDFKDELNTFRSKLLEQYPHRYPEQQRKGCVINGLTIHNLTTSYSPYTNEDYDKYNHQIDEFIDAMVEHQRKILTYSAIDACIKEVRVSILIKVQHQPGKWE